MSRTHAALLALMTLSTACSLDEADLGTAEGDLAICEPGAIWWGKSVAVVTAPGGRCWDPSYADGYAGYCVDPKPDVVASLTAFDGDRGITFLSPILRDTLDGGFADDVLSEGYFAPMFVVEAGDERDQLRFRIDLYDFDGERADDREGLDHLYVEPIATAVGSVACEDAGLEGLTYEVELGDPATASVRLTMDLLPDLPDVLVTDDEPEPDLDGSGPTPI